MILTKNSENKIKFLILLFIFLFSISISNVISRNYYSDNSSYGQETQYQKFFRVVKKLYVPEDNKNYNCEIENNLDERHKLRWPFQALWSKSFIKISEVYGEKKIIYDFYKIFLGLILFSGFLLIINIYKKEDFFKIIFPCSSIFLIFSLLISSSVISEINYTIIEYIFLCAALYFIKKNYFYPLLLLCCLAPLNRESGFIILLLYPLFYPKNIKNFIFLGIISSVIYFLANYQIIKCIFTPGFLITTNPNYESISDWSLFETSKILLNNFIFYFFIIFLFWKKNINQKKILIIFLIYSLSFILAAPLNHSIVKLLYIPLLMIYVAEFYKENKIKFNNI